MAQHDYDIANQSGANFRADLNNALDAIVSNNSGSSEPSTTFAYEWWIDTSANVLKLRNSANNAWITLPLSITADNSTSGALTVNGNLSTTGTLDVNGGEIILDSDADTSITSDTDDQIDFKIGNVDVATLTNSHLVLKGTTPKITIGDGGEEDTALIFDGNAQDFYIGLDDSADDLVIGTGSTVGSNQKLVIDEDGHVGIGHLSPDFPLVVRDSTTSNYLNVIAATNGNAGIAFGDDDAELSAGILFKNDTGALRFFKSGFSEAARIDSSGNFLVGKTTTAFGTAGMHLQGSTGRTLNTVNGDNVMDLNRLTSNGVILGFYFNSVSVGTISTNANNLPSDRNFKRNISDLNLGLNLVTKLKPSQYNYKIDDEDCPKMYGLIAQDLEQALQEVGVEKNSSWLLQHEPNDDEKQSDYGLDYLKLTPVLIKAIQEQQEIIDDLKSRIETLEG